MHSLSALLAVAAVGISSAVAQTPNAYQSWQNDYADVDYDFVGSNRFNMTWDNSFGVSETSSLYG